MHSGTEGAPADLGLARGLLERHRRSGISAEERLTVERIEHFMGAHPDCLNRSCLEGHLTGSAWILSRDRTKTLLTHHRKLGKWLQLGGHADGDPDLLAVALREAREESGLHTIEADTGELFDVDRHWIPSRKLEPGHWHHDFRFVFLADPSETLTISEESKELAWVPVAEVTGLNPEESMARMVRKSLAR